MQASLSHAWRSRAGRWSMAAYAAASVLLWPIPLLNVLHVESAAVLAGVAFLVSGLSSLRLFREGLSVAPVVLWQIVVLTLPLALMTVAVAWAPNCTYATGLLFFALFPVVSAILACSVASLLHALETPRARAVFMAIAIGVAVFPPLYDIGFHPQLYTYNHVFGGILGPIYDEQLAIRPGLFAFRGLSLAWALTMWLAGRVATRRSGFRDPLTAITLAASVGLLVAYSFSARLGWNTTDATVQRSLDRSVVTDHFEVRFDARSVRSSEMDQIVDNLEYRYSVLSELLATEVAERIRVYVYPTERSKGSLTGSRSTSVAPVWLKHPQIHILKRRVSRSLDHELVHVFAREFGLPLLRASPRIGLVEGLASALEAPDGRPSSGDLIEAVIQDGSRDSVTVIKTLESSLGAFGFWTGRGAVSYAATGSFVRFLIDRYGVDAFKSAYRTGDFESAYKKSIPNLTSEWYFTIRRAQPVSRSAGPIAEARFSVPSLFETECPHSVPGFVADYRDGVDHMSVFDTLAAVRLFERSLSADSTFLPSRAALASIELRRGDVQNILASIAADTAALRYPQLKVLVADAYAVSGDRRSAVALYDEVVDMLPAYVTDVRMLLSFRRRLASDSLAAAWFVSGRAEQTAPANLVDDPFLSLYTAARALSRDQLESACLASADWTQQYLSALADEGSTMFEAQALLWQAQACSVGRPALAEKAARDAERLFLSAGEVDLARLAADRAGFARWKLSRTDDRRSPTPTESIDDVHTQ